MNIVAVFTNGHEYTVRHRIPLLQQLRREGWRVVGVAPEKSAALQVFAEQGFTTAVVSLSRTGTNPLSELRAIWSVVRCYRRIHPTLAIHATIKPVLYGTIAARWQRIPVVNLITGLGFVYASSSPRARLSRAVISVLYRAVFLYRDQRVIFQNHDDRNELVRFTGLRRDHSVVVPGSGVDVEHFSFAPGRGEDYLVVLPGRMLYDKGITEFVSAAAYLRRRFPDIRFVLVGPADPENPAGIPKRVLDQWNLDGSVEWWGAVDDMREVYGQAAVIALPSRREGMPKVVLEAAACGLPVVTTDVPGCRESVVDGTTGLLVPYGDSAALATAIERILDNPELRRDMGIRARELAEERFAAPRIVGKILNAARELL